ncbi:hypothetical protein CONPUDRAFT_144599 [Coniophora puteana RWD-64-598 SS2]|uniref:Uncharacterized protein n=1 Tax=Coniophora puteana (strain RWD-64-598) TaxID=741705 RepID=A0A5M3MMZ1_CONPW|nr:uncharacterized protein CONPUDRAFT_144599 [Coniophora puteana RWD-64-598 SS2]EIW80548.1 hypothetical protein CONPUDRAFT_144599 [Coniophora puteana RWD-64-598 SS2]
MCPNVLCFAPGRCKLSVMSAPRHCPGDHTWSTAPCANAFSSAPGEVFGAKLIDDRRRRETCSAIRGSKNNSVWLQIRDRQRWLHGRSSLLVVDRFDDEDEQPLRPSQPAVTLSKTVQLSRATAEAVYRGHSINTVTVDYTIGDGEGQRHDLMTGGMDVNACSVEQRSGTVRQPGWNLETGPVAFDCTPVFAGTFKRVLRRVSAPPA